jgi:two-component system sensor histidine kinase UhpB
MTHPDWFAVCCVVGGLLVASHVWFFARVLRPLRRLALQAEQMRGGSLDAFEQNCGGIAEINALRRAMASMVGHVRRAQSQSRAYADQLAAGQEHERKRLARELHDETVQGLIAIAQSIDLAANWLGSDVERAAGLLRGARQQAVSVAQNLRNLIGGLRPPALEELGLAAALEMQIASIRPVEVRLEVEGVPRRLSETAELTLFRAAQEVLTNVCRHSEAAHAEVLLTYQPDQVRLHISDDGRGFRVPPTLGDLALDQHFGLVGIDERVRHLGGSTHITSQPGSGTHVTVCLPTATAAPPAHLVRDPVCSALLEPEQVYASLTHEGAIYHFCCPVCQGAFMKDPLPYLS